MTSTLLARFSVSFNLQFTIYNAGSVCSLKCDTADVNFPFSFVCTKLANSGYNGIFSLTDILQIAVVIRQVVLVLFLPIFHRAFRLPCFCLAIATVFQVWSTLDPEYWLFHYLLAEVSHNQTKPKEKNDRLRKKRENELGIPVARFKRINLVGVWTVLFIIRWVESDKSVKFWDF